MQWPKINQPESADKHPKRGKRFPSAGGSLLGVDAESVQFS
jgi:hypothetical protein